MWGNELQFDLQTNNVAVSQQVTRISYKRPETWCFLFTGRIVSHVAGSSPGIPLLFAFDVTIGIGRSVATMPRFCVLELPAIPTDDSLPPLVWAQAAYTRGLFNDTTSATADVAVDTIVAQDIQVQATCQLPLGGEIPMTVGMAAYFAPRSHIRPDWFREGGHFDGDEWGGT